MTTEPDARATRTAKPRRMARPTCAEEPAGLADAPLVASTPRAPSKLDRLEAMLLAPRGACIAELMAATGWQQHSVRGAMAGALRKRGLSITSDKDGAARRYRAVRPA